MFVYFIYLFIYLLLPPTVNSVELSQIHSMLYNSAATGRSDRGSIYISSEGFQNIMSHFVPSIAQSPAMHRLFKALDQNHDNKLDFREMIVGLSILAKGTLDEKLELLFKSFDVDNTGYITQAQLESLITSVSAQMDPEHPERYSSMGGGVVGTDPLGVKVVPVNVFVSQVFAHLCITTGRLSLDQFRQAVIAEPRLIQCLMIGSEQEEASLAVPPPPSPSLLSSSSSTPSSSSSPSSSSQPHPPTYPPPSPAHPSLGPPSLSLTSSSSSQDDSFPQQDRGRSDSAYSTNLHADIDNDERHNSSVGGEGDALPLRVNESDHKTPLLSSSNDYLLTPPDEKSNTRRRRKILVCNNNECCILM